MSPIKFEEEKILFLFNPSKQKMCEDGYNSIITPPSFKGEKDRATTLNSS